MRSLHARGLLVGVALVLVAACSGDGVSSKDQAKTAYLSLDTSIDRAINLGFAGFNAAQSANIPTQSASGDASGTMSIDGQVDQGASANKTMRLKETLTGYSDDGKIVNTTTQPAELDMDLKGIPNGTMTGTLAGTYAMEGDLKGNVTLDLTLSSALQPDAQDASKVVRKPGTTRIQGKATSGSAVFDIDITR